MSMPHLPPQTDDDLPPPWIRQFDTTYNTFFYVDPTTNPPRTSWTRPGLEDGQAAPEQLETMQMQQPAQEQGHAAAYFAGDHTQQSAASAQYAAEARQATPGVDGGGGGGGDGERGFMGNMATNMVMSKLGMRPSGGGGMVGKLASSLLGGNKQSSYGQPAGPPPFMGGGGGGGIGGMINGFMGKPQQQGYGQQQWYGQQQQGGGGLGGMLNSFMGGNKPQQQYGGQGQGHPPGAYPQGPAYQQGPGYQSGYGGGGQMYQQQGQGQGGFYR